MSSPRSTMMDHLIKNKSNCPYIAFRGIRLWLEYLGRHVEWCAHRSSIFDSFGDIFFSEAEISDFGYSFAEQDIGRFEVASSW